VAVSRGVVGVVAHLSAPTSTAPLVPALTRFLLRCRRMHSLIRDPAMWEPGDIDQCFPRTAHRRADPAASPQHTSRSDVYSSARARSAVTGGESFSRARWGMRASAYRLTSGGADFRRSRPALAAHRPLPCEAPSCAKHRRVRLHPATSNDMTRCAWSALDVRFKSAQEFAPFRAP